MSNAWVGCVTTRSAWARGWLYKPGNYINLNKAERQCGFTEKNCTIVIVCMYFSNFWLALTLPTCTFRIKETRKEADYKVRHRRCCCSSSSLYTTILFSVIKNIRYFSDRGRSFVNLNDLYALDCLYLNNSSLVNSPAYFRSPDQESCLPLSGLGVGYNPASWHPCRVTNTKPSGLVKLWPRKSPSLRTRRLSNGTLSLHFT